MFKRLTFRFIWLLVPLLVLLAAPDKGYSTPIVQQDNLVFGNMAFGNAPLVEVDVSVYDSSSSDLPLADFSLDPGQYLYVYGVKNVDMLPFPMTLVAFSIYRDKEAPVDAIWSESGHGTSVEGMSILFDLALPEQQTDVLYIVSTAGPVLVHASFIASYGATDAASSPLVYAPDPPDPDMQMPEPGTLILLGGGLVCLAGLRRRFKQKAS